MATANWVNIELIYNARSTWCRGLGGKLPLLLITRLPLKKLLGQVVDLNRGSLLLSYYYLSTWIVYTNFVLGVSQLITKCLIKYLITYFYYLTDDVVVSLFCHLPNIYRELLEPSLINKVLILDCPFNTS
jgi:hypothetical protein